MNESLDLDPNELVTLYMYQTAERSAATSWGIVVEDICKVAGAMEIPDSEQINKTGKAFDLKKEKKDNTYYIQIKSGSNTMNVGMVDSLNDSIDSIENKNKDSIGILVMTYGKHSIVSQQIKANLEDYDQKSYIGDEFWELISEDPNYMDFLVNTINEINGEISEDFGKDYSTLLEQKISELSDQWIDKYE